MNKPAYRQFERQREAEAITAHWGADEDQSQDWTPMRGHEITDQMVEDFIEDFAATGRIEDEFGYAKNCAGSTDHAIARQWVADKEAVGSIIGPVFWAWAKACVSLQFNGRVTQ